MAAKATVSSNRRVNRGCLAVYRARDDRLQVGEGVAKQGLFGNEWVRCAFPAGCDSCGVQCGAGEQGYA